jgi:hypothetical protein
MKKNKKEVVQETSPTTLETSFSERFSKMDTLPLTIRLQALGDHGIWQS